MDKGIIYYTDNRIQEPIRSVVRSYILASGLPIVSSSLEPIDFGTNLVLRGKERGYTTQVEQIITALESSMAEAVFFCEHDVLYHLSHFEFTPERDDVYYYNFNNCRWDYPRDRIITYDELTSLSMLCAKRNLVLRHYKMRLSKIREMGWDDKSPEPQWARAMGYEPGTKKRKRGGLTDEDYEKWNSTYPCVDIRHKGTFSRPKVKLEEFKHLPTNWRETTLDKVPGWNLKELFEL